jgi:uncharacterized membrane protein YphA (DoxX/SURF4 family)
MQRDLLLKAQRPSILSQGSMKNRNVANSIVANSIAGACFVVAVGLLTWWAAAGASVFTHTAKLVQEKDELFGTITQHWEKAFQPGIEYVGPVAGLFLIAGAWLLVANRRKLNRQIA